MRQLSPNPFSSNNTVMIPYLLSSCPAAPKVPKEGAPGCQLGEKSLRRVDCGSIEMPRRSMTSERIFGAKEVSKKSGAKKVSADGDTADDDDAEDDTGDAASRRGDATAPAAALPPSPAAAAAAQVAAQVAQESFVDDEDDADDAVGRRSK